MVDSVSKNNCCQDGENAYELFLQLFLAHQHEFYAIILASVHNYTDADDLLQNSSIVMWNKFSDFTQGSDFRAWGYAIVRYQILSFFEQRKRSKIQFNPALLQRITDTVMAKSPEMHDRLNALRRCFEKLSEEQRKLLDMRYRQGMMVKTIANLIGKPIQGLYKAIARLQHALLKCIESQLLTEGPS